MGRRGQALLPLDGNRTEKAEGEVDVLYFWMFMLGVLIFGKLFRVIPDNKSLAIIMIGAAIVYVVWRVLRAKGKAKRAAREFEQTRQQVPQKKRTGKNPSHKGKNR